MADSWNSAQAFPRPSLGNRVDGRFPLTSLRDCGNSVGQVSGEGACGSLSTSLPIARLYKSQVYWSCTLCKSSSLKYPDDMSMAFKRSFWKHLGVPFKEPVCQRQMQVNGRAQGRHWGPSPSLPDSTLHNFLVYEELILKRCYEGPECLLHLCFRGRSASSSLPFPHTLMSCKRS